jgi:integrase
MVESKRQRNDGIRKRCDCPRRAWAKCPHDWHFSFMWNGQPYRFSLDVELGRHVATKEEARAEADALRAAIRAGTFVRAKDRPVPAPTPDGGVTFGALGELWLSRAKRPRRDAVYLRSLCKSLAATGEALGTKVATGVTEDDLETVFDQLKARGLAASTRNQHLQTVKSVQTWGRRKGYLDRPWLSELTALKRDQHARRDRRLAPGEEARLLAVAGPWLQRLIIAAIETCARRGELLALTWGDVSLTRGELTIRAVEAGARKTGKGRVIPISPRLRGVLDMVRHDPAGNDHPASAYVFGNAIGERVGSPATAWENAVLKAHGQPVTRDKKTHALTPEARAALDAINLHFHDLRHEGGSRLLEKGWPLHHVQAMLGHANIAQTSTYLNVQKTGLQESMRRFAGERLHSFAPEGIGEPSSPSKTDTSNNSHVVVN